MSLGRIIVALVCLGLLAGLKFAVDHWVLLSRYYSMAETAGPNGHYWYQPVEAVPGDHAGYFELQAESKRTVSAEALAAANDYAKANRSESLLIWHRGALQSRAHWMDTAPGDVVNSRSMHKMLAGLLIARAIEEGHIESVDDPVPRYVREWSGSDREAMTIEHVLHMASGLRWFGIRDSGPFGLSSRRYLDPEWDRVLIDEVPMSFEPGTAYDYSDMTADVIPHIIEGATGQRYASYLSEALIKPIGGEGGHLWINRPDGFPHGGCCLMLPPETWLRLGILLLNDGVWAGQRLLPEGWREAMVAPSPNNPHFGRMIWRGAPYVERRLYHRPDSPINQVPKPGVYHSEPYLAEDLFLFDGFEGRVVYIVPSEQLVIVRTGFRPPPDQPEWDNAFLPNTILRGISKEARETTP